MQTVVPIHWDSRVLNLNLLGWHCHWPRSKWQFAVQLTNCTCICTETHYTKWMKGQIITRVFGVCKCFFLYYLTINGIFSHFVSSCIPVTMRTKRYLSFSLFLFLFATFAWHYHYYSHFIYEDWQVCCKNRSIAPTEWNSQWQFIVEHSDTSTM